MRRSTDFHLENERSYRRRSRVIDDIRISEPVAYFYMSSGRLHSASDLVASLLKQLCLQFRFVPRRLKEAYEQSEDESHLLLEPDDMLEALKDATRNIRKDVTIVVDGLDEVNMNERKPFVKILATLKETSWNWLFISRPNQDFLDSALKGCSRFSLESFHLVHDIRHFVVGALGKSKALHTM